MRHLVCILTSVVALVVVQCWCLFAVQAQPLSPRESKDSKGKEFWVTFPVNEHNPSGSFLTDSLYFFIAAERSTSITIRSLHNGSSRTLFLRNPNEMFTVGYTFVGNELQVGEVPSREVFHITSDEEITVYAMNFADRTTDAFLVFPKDVLGRDYRIFSYQNNLPRRSNFAIVATEDSTDVLITPSQPTRRNGQLPHRVLLRRGEAYLVEAASTGGLSEPADLTGTRVLATKPIAVYGGHQRAVVPYFPPRMDDVPRTQDYMMEQMLPTNVWRNSCFIVPLPAAGPFVSFRLPFPDSSRLDVVRIMAAQDSTTVSINESPTATLQNTTRATVTLNAGAFYEHLVGQPAVVRASKPIAAMIYRRSGLGGFNGDPFMAALPPVEQLLSRYRYLNVQGRQVYPRNNIAEAFIEHHVSVVIPTSKLPTLRLNGNTVDRSLFRPVAATGYSYGLLPSEATVWDLRADTTFGITVYGYGPANSYGYIGGMRFETDTLAPRLATERSCFGVQGMIYDSSSEDTKIFWFDSPDTSRRNVDFRFGRLPRPADSLSFAANLVNVFEDGEFLLETTDSLDLLTRRRYFLPGFTVHLNPAFRRNEIVQLSTNAIALAAGVERCFDLTLTNYGSTTQVLSTLDFAGLGGMPQREFYTSTTLPIVLAPRSSRRVSVCFRSDRDGVFRDTIRIGNECLTRPIAVIEVESGFDRTAPSLSRQADSCARTVNYRFADAHRYASGVAAVELQTEQSQNVTFTTTRNPDGSLSTLARLTNPRRDAIVTLLVRDSVGNTRLVRDTLQGFPLRFVLPTGSATTTNTVNVLNFGTTDATSVTCQSVQVWNDGILPFVLTPPLLAQNTIFSVPVGQFPLVIAAGASRQMRVCFAPAIVQQYSDGLTIQRLCDRETIQLAGAGGIRSQGLQTRCSVDVRITPIIRSTAATAVALTAVALAALQPKVSHYPDPAGEELVLRVEHEVAGEYELTVCTALGVPVLRKLRQRWEAGVWEFVVQLDSLESGAYFYVLRGERAVRTGAFRVAK